jgi:hypothetical protein
LHIDKRRECVEDRLSLEMSHWRRAATPASGVRPEPVCGAQPDTQGTHLKDSLVDLRMPVTDWRMTNIDLAGEHVSVLLRGGIN